MHASINRVRDSIAPFVATHPKWRKVDLPALHLTSAPKSNYHVSAQPIPMKTLLRLLVGFCFAACVASAHAELSSVSFVVGKQQFKTGDSIMIDQVLATSPNLAVGTKVVVRGHYQLASSSKARIGLFVTHRVQSPADPSASSQIAAVENTSGSFEVSCEINYEGDPHVSFYPASGGESFGGVYFSVTPQKS